MDGKRIQNYWSNEMQAMLDTYKQFQILIPAENRNGAAHNGEDGRYVETLIREYLKRYLPKDLEVLTGFILRPAVKTGLKNRSRKNEVDSHSTQLDILIYDSAKYPIFQRFGENVIVPPEGVAGIISVKKNLHENDIVHEAQALKAASKLCRCVDVLIVLFAYFYTSITFNPLEVANNMKKSGGFIPGVRPGKPTSEYLDKILNYIVFIGAVGLIIVSVIPIIISGVFTVSRLSFMGTSLIIIVSVILETIKAIESQMIVRNYKGFLND